MPCEQNVEGFKRHIGVDQRAGLCRNLTVVLLMNCLTLQQQCIMFESFLETRGWHPNTYRISLHICLLQCVSPIHQFRD